MQQPHRMGASINTFFTHVIPHFWALASTLLVSKKGNSLSKFFLLSRWSLRMQLSTKHLLNLLCSTKLLMRWQYWSPMMCEESSPQRALEAFCSHGCARLSATLMREAGLALSILATRSFASEEMSVQLPPAVQCSSQPASESITCTTYITFITSHHINHITSHRHNIKKYIHAYNNVHYRKNVDTIK
jgi:hypothetical protein